MTLIPLNPYTWHASAKRVRSHVVNVTLATNDTHALNVSNLNSSIDIRIPVKPQDGDLPKQLFYKKPGILGYHYFDVEFPETLVDVKIPIQRESTKILAYVKYGQRPTVTDFDFNVTLPDFSSCTTNSSADLFSHTDCSDHPYTVVKRVFDKPGRYYIGVSIYKLNITTVRVRRSCLKGRRKKRSCIEVKAPPLDPSSGEFVDVIPERDEKVDENYTLTMNQGSCVYWLETNETWTTEGCVVRYVSFYMKIGISDVSRIIQVCTHKCRQQIC